MVAEVNSNISMVPKRSSNSVVTVQLPRSQERNDNPIPIQGNGIIHSCTFRAELPIAVPKDEPFAHLGSLRNLEIVIGVEHASKETQILDPITMNVDQFHHSIENQLIQLTKIQVMSNPRWNSEYSFSLERILDF